MTGYASGQNPSKVTMTSTYLLSDGLENTLDCFGVEHRHFATAFAPSFDEKAPLTTCSTATKLTRMYQPPTAQFLTDLHDTPSHDPPITAVDRRPPRLTTALRFARFAESFASLSVFFNRAGLGSYNFENDVIDFNVVSTNQNKLIDTGLTRPLGCARHTSTFFSY